MVDTARNSTLDSLYLEICSLIALKENKPRKRPFWRTAFPAKAKGPSEARIEVKIRWLVFGCVDQ
jgi:hypothetical protein